MYLVLCEALFLHFKNILLSLYIPLTLVNLVCDFEISFFCVCVCVLHRLQKSANSLKDSKLRGKYNLLLLCSVNEYFIE